MRTVLYAVWVTPGKKAGAIERIAREKYLMKKPNEDIYVFEEDIEE